MGRYSRSAVWQRFFEKASIIAVKDNSGVAACLACAQIRLDLRAFHFTRLVSCYLRASQWQMHCRSPPFSIRISHKNLNGGNLDGDHPQHRWADRVRRSQH